MRKTGLTLIEIIVSTLILALVMMGLVNIFISGKRYLLHTRSRMTGGELGRYFLDPLQIYVNQSQWQGDDYISDHPLSLTASRSGGSQFIDNINYSATYEVSHLPTLDGPGNQTRKVKVTLKWNETQP
jgi:hypothetical protein